MNITLIQGQFSSTDAIELLTKMVHVQIKFHENKICNTNNEEDVKMREKKIIQLQKYLFESNESMSKKTVVGLNSVITID